MTVTSPRRRTAPVLDHLRHGDVAALVADGNVWTHAQLADAVMARAASWGPARRLVLVEASNAVESLVAHLAALQHGHVVLVVPGGREDQLDATVLAYDPDIVCRIGERVGDTRAHDEIRRMESAHDLHPELALLLSTSGTTGSPKLVRLSRDNVASNAVAIADYLALTSHDRAITSLPLHYCYGLSVLHSHLVAGASVVLTDLSVVDECFWDLFASAGATSFAGVPHTFDLLRASGFEKRSLPRLRQITQAGGRLAPAEVAHWARSSRQHSRDFVVMYGQTEATARMAWLPPGLAEQHPSAIGIAIAGGHLRLDESVDERPGVGELVYSGPNVMLGYARSPADLGRARDVRELRTGDLARQVDGLFEIVGRCNRYGKVFGLRIDLAALESRLHDEVDRSARVVATDRAVHVFLTHGRRSGATRDLTTSQCGVPTHAVHTHVLPEIPRTSSGKTDYASLQALAEQEFSHQTSARAATPTTIRQEFVRVLGCPDAGREDSFVGLGGDSLSYVELSTRLADHFPRGLPQNWHTRSIGELDALAREEPDPCRTPRHTPRRTRLDTTVALRAIAILFVVASHVDLVSLEGGAHLLLALAGFNFARFQLSSPGGARRRLRHGLSGVSQLVVPSALWIGGIALIFGTYHLTTALFVREFVNDTEWDDQWQFWFLEALVWITLAALALTCLPGLHRAERRWPFGFAVAVLGATALARFAEVGLQAGATQRYLTVVVAFFFALGWAGARADTTGRRILVSAIAIALTAGFFGQPMREAIVLGGFLLMLWLPHVSVPAPVARWCGVLAGASLFIYLTHWQVYPPLEDRGHQWLALVASIGLGIGYGRLVRPLHQAVGRAVLGSR